METKINITKRLLAPQQQKYMCNYSYICRSLLVLWWLFHTDLVQGKYLQQSSMPAIIIVIIIITNNIKNNNNNENYNGCNLSYWMFWAVSPGIEPRACGRNWECWEQETSYCKCKKQSYQPPCILQDLSNYVLTSR